MGHCFERSLGRNFACLDVVVPKFMVLFGPGFINVSSAHGTVSALHANGAHVNVAQEHTHHEDCGYAMNHVGNLHGAALVNETRNELVKHQARSHHYDAQAQHTQLEHHFLTCVEAV